VVYSGGGKRQLPCLLVGGRLWPGESQRYWGFKGGDQRTDVVVAGAEMGRVKFLGNNRREKERKTWILVALFSTLVESGATGGKGGWAIKTASSKSPWHRTASPLTLLGEGEGTKGPHERLTFGGRIRKEEKKCLGPVSKASSQTQTGSGGPATVKRDATAKPRLSSSGGGGRRWTGVRGENLQYAQKNISGKAEGGSCNVPSHKVERETR